MAFHLSCPMNSSGRPTPDSQNSPMPSGFQSVNPWMQVTPSVMPWSVENRPQLVRFGDTCIDTSFWTPSYKPKCCKRKSNLDFNPKPVKVHITEEKMAAQLENMHISNNNTDQIFGSGLDKTEYILPTLVLSKEVQNLPTFQEPLIPEELLNNVRKPSKALVLWKPPAGSFSSQFINRLQDDSDDAEVEQANNNTSSFDLNPTTTGVGNSSFEMEL